MNTKSDNQKLIDITFQIVMTMHNYPDLFKDMTREELGEWTAKQLRDNGFDTVPCGASWGVLKSVK